MRNSNTVLRRANERAMSETYSGQKATYLGVGLKTLYFIIATILGGALGIALLVINPDAYFIALALSGIIGFISAIVAMRTPRLSFSFGTVYCLMEGMLLGVVSVLCMALTEGIVLTAVVSTVAVVLGCAFLYITGIVKTTNNFYKFLFTVAIGFIVSMLLIFILSLFGLVDTESFGLNVLVSSISVIIASLFLMSDMNYAAMIVENEGPKELEWMVSFGIAYTILWIYYEILRLVILIFGRDR